ncbi:MAG: ABC transporter permease [Gemmatimonadota bacterium]
MKRLEWYMARRYLASRRKGRFVSLITLIAVGGIFLGVMALITVIAVMAGLQEDLRDRILGTNPHVYVFEQGASFRLGGWERVAGAIDTFPEVRATAPYVVSHVAAMRQDNLYMQPGRVLGILPGAGREPLSLVDEQIQEGELSFRTGSSLPGALVGYRLAAHLSLLPGDTLLVLSMENIRAEPTVSGGLMPAMRQFEVAGTFDTGMYEYDAVDIYVPMAAAQDLLGLPEDTVSGILVNLHDPDQAREVGPRLAEAAGWEYITQDWMSMNAALFSALRLEKIAMGVILFLIVVVAAFNIVSTLVMVVADKTREIGILKSMGMTDGMVLRIFMLQGLAVGIIGTVLGGIGGWLLVTLVDRYELIKLEAQVYFIDTLPVSIQPLDIGLILVGSVLISFLATIYPARQAARLVPVEAIRHE